MTSLMLHCLSIWLLASVLHRAGLSHRMLVFFGAILLLPLYVEPAGYVLSENLTETTLVVSFVAAVRWMSGNRARWILLSGAALGFAALTRPTYQLLALAIAACITIAAYFRGPWLDWKAVISGSLLVIGASLLIVGGYAFVNYRQFGHFAVGQPGLVLSTKTFAFVERLPEEYEAVKTVLIRARNEAVAAAGWHDAADSIHIALPELREITGLKDAELSDYLFQLNVSLIRRAPLSYLREVVHAFGTYWFPASGQLAHLNSLALQAAYNIVHFIVMGAFALTVLVLGGAGLLLYHDRGKRLRRISSLLGCDLRGVESLAMMYALAGSIVLYTALVSSVFEIGTPRYRVPTDALIICMVFLGGQTMRRLTDLADELCSTEATRGTESSRDDTIGPPMLLDRSLPEHDA